jgi:glucose/arabinose dehydrogenase
MRKIYYLLLVLTTTIQAQTVSVEQFATGLNSIVDIANCGDDRLFVVQQNGVIRVLNSNGTAIAGNFLNIASLISTGGERGLLGIAFHPNYATNGFFFLNYTNTAGDTVIARYSVNPNNPNQALSNSGVIVMTIDQPFGNHNGGTLKFGPDGMLYIGMGDGGSGGDPNNYAQNINSLLGKMLRINVDTLPYTIPADNPFVGAAGSDEIYATGLRNPWKFCFDYETGDLWIADVGQQNIEEINKELYTVGGLNYGWRCYEGNSAYNTTGCVAQSELTFPEAVYPSTNNTAECSITGGYVYRGTQYPSMVGLYFFTDYCSGRIGTVSQNGTLTWRTTGNDNLYTTFGEDVNKNLYVAGGGTIFRVIDSALSIDQNETVELKIVPNPTSDFLRIDANDQAFPAQLKVFDLNGKLLLDAQYQKNQAVSISDWASGFYVAQLTLANGQQSTLKFNKK